MDCGDAGHILVSKHAAEDLEQYDQWQPYLHDLGECEIKHGERLHLVNFYNHEIGNSAMPSKLSKSDKAAASAATPPGRSRYSTIALGIGALIVVGAAALFFASRSAFRTASGRVEPAPALAAAVSEKSIAVLPFENLSRDPDNAYFTYGIQDEILTRLSKIAALKVISRTSTQKYKSAPDNLRDVGRQLGVATLLAGSVQKVSNAVHVNVQLIRAANDEHLWAESYNRKLDDIFGVEGEVAGAIAEQLNAKLSGDEKQVLSAKPTKNPAAYDAYLRGLAFEGRADALLPNILNSISAFGEATRLDPDFGIAWAHLARQQGFAFSLSDQSAHRREEARAALQNATKLAPEAPETQLADGFYHYWIERDYETAKRRLEALRAQYPNDSAPPYVLAAIARRQGRWDQSRRLFAEALDLDPQNVFLLVDASLDDIAM